VAEEKTPLQESFERLLKPINIFSQYSRTRSAIIKGESLWDLDKQALEERQLLSAWSFNLQETALAAIPVNVVIKILNFFFDSAKTATTEYAEIVRSVEPFFKSFNAPLILTLCVFLLAIGSLKDGDQLPSKLAKAERAYLYIDGAHGIWTQGGISICTGLMTWISFHPGAIPLLTQLNLLLMLLLSYFTIAQFHETQRKVPFALFKANGYSPRLPSMLQSLKSLILFVPIGKGIDPDGLWDRYLTKMWICFGLIIPSTLWATDKLAAVAAWILASLKSLVH